MTVDNYRLAPEAARFQLPLREIPMLSDYEGCYAKASVSVLSLRIDACDGGEDARRSTRRRLDAKLERSRRLAATAEQ